MNKAVRGLGFLILSLWGMLASEGLLKAQSEVPIHQKDGAVICNVLNEVGESQSSRFPVLRLNSTEQLRISFDLLDQEDEVLCYRLVHCNKDWKRSQLQAIEYIDGFAEYNLESAAYSNSTLKSYLHYQLLLPNDITKIKHSGNYRVEIFNPDEEKLILSVPFAVYEEEGNVEAELLSQTYQDARGEKQQVNVAVKLFEQDLQQASRETKVVVLQNGRWDNAVVLDRVSSLLNNKLEYKDFSGAVFEGGNEYHKLEHLYDKGVGIGIFKQDLWANIYRLTLYPQKNRSREAYVFDKDQNGRCFIRSMETDEPDTEADYHWLDFSFISPKLSGGDVLIEGEAFNYLPLSQRKMNYNEERGAYELRLLIKEGYQEYQFLFLPYGAKTLSSAETEGNHYQTTNDYQVLIYRRKAGDRADRLIAYTKL